MDVAHKGAAVIELLRSVVEPTPHIPAVMAATNEGAASAPTASEPSLRDVVNAIKAMPYGRPTQPTAARCVAEWRGTCSTKHSLLELVLRKRWPDTLPRLVHRVYRLTRADALARYGPDVAAVVPEDGLIDVHRYALILLHGRDVVLDVTFAAADDWDGKSSMPLACGDGDDYLAGADGDEEKRNLERRFCDPRVRESFIAALTQHT